jgi:hypothetical protein
MRFATPNLATERLSRAKNSIGALRSTLLDPSPEALEAHLPALEAALHDLRSLEQNGELCTRRELEAVALELRAAGSLIAHGIEFQRGWAKLLATAFGDYRPNGEPRPLQARGSVSVQG